MTNLPLPTLTTARDVHGDPHRWVHYQGVVFLVTRHEYIMPYRSTQWRVEASRPVFFGKRTLECDTLADAREEIRAAFVDD